MFVIEIETLPFDFPCRVNFRLNPLIIATCMNEMPLALRAVDLVKSLLGKGDTTDFQVRQWGIRRTRKSVLPLKQQAVTRGIAVGSLLTGTGYHRVARVRSLANPWARRPCHFRTPRLTIHQSNEPLSFGLGYCNLPIALELGVKHHVECFADFFLR